MQSKGLIERIDILTGVRFLAAIHVVLFHNFSFFGFENVSPWITHFIYKGEAAVSFFFILSGYILTHAYRHRLGDSKQKKKYFISRLAKLYPLYFVAFFIDLPRGLHYFFSEYTSKEAIIKTLVSSLAHLSMMQSWVPRLTASWNPPAWSLSCELFFYFVFIFAMKPLIQSSRKGLILLFLYLLPICIYLFLDNIVLVNTDTSIFHTFWRSFPLLKINEFFIGILLYALHLEEKKTVQFIKDFGGAFFWVSILTSIILTTLARPYIPRDLFSSVLFVPIFSLIIISSQSSSLFGKKIFESKLMVYLGTISYALYILHQPVATYFSLVFENSILKGLIYISSVILIAHFCYKFIERPCYKKLRNKFNSAVL